MRKLIGRRKRAFRPPAPKLGNDGKPSRVCHGQSAPARAREGRTASNSARRNISPGHMRTSRRPPSCSSGGSQATSVLPRAELEWEDALHTLARPKSGRACGPDAIPSELVAAGGQVPPSAGSLVSHGVQRGSSDSLERRRHGGLPSQTRTDHTEEYQRSAVLQLPRKDRRQSSSSGTLASHVSWHVANWGDSRRRNRRS